MKILHLHLHLKRKWFNQIKSGEKTVEFRRATPYWRKMLVGKSYDEIWLYDGYPKSGDTDRIMKRKWKLITKEILLHEEFGPEPVEVFCIDLSQRIGE